MVCPPESKACSDPVIVTSVGFTSSKVVDHLPPQTKCGMVCIPEGAASRFNTGIDRVENFASVTTAAKAETGEDAMKLNVP